MKFVEILASYLPSLIVKHLVDHDTASNPPSRQRYDTVCMFADVSGFTALSEAMAKYGDEGAEYLAKHLNSYFGQMVRIIASEGGDIFKFAGDAMIVLWPDIESLSVTARVRRAAQSALKIQESLHKAELAEGVTLSVKIGIGVGQVSVLHLGGVLGRMEYVAVGEPLVQAFGAEHHAASGGEVILSPEAWGRVKEFFEPMETMDGGQVRIKSCTQPMKKISKLVMLKGYLDLENASTEVERRLRCYVPGAIMPWLNPESPDEESWGGDLRNVCVLFVNLGLRNHDLLAASKFDDAMQVTQDVLRAVQLSVYQYEGSVNKFLMDDKGSTLIAVFGLPPLAHENDATRGVLCGLDICRRLWEQKLLASVGVTVGTVFCGVVGSTTRKEYSVLGDIVNLSARLMQRACVTGGGVLCDYEVRIAADKGLSFKELPTIQVKGKTTPIRIFKPYPDGIDLPNSDPPGKMPCKQEEAYTKQVWNFESSRCLRPQIVDAPETVMEAGGSGGGGGPSTPTADAGKSRRGSLLSRGSSALLNSSSSPTPVTLSTVKWNGGSSKTPPLRRLQHFLPKVSAPFSMATLPSIKTCGVYVAPEMSNPEILLRQMQYRPETMKSLSKPIPLDSVPTLRALRNACVEAAKGQGLIPKQLHANEFVLQIRDSDTFVPISDLGTIWLTVYGVESGALLDYIGNATKNQVFLNIVRRKDIDTLQISHSSVRHTLIECKMNLCAERAGDAILLESESGMGKTEILNGFLNTVLVNKCTVFAVAASPFKRGQAYGVWADLLCSFIVKYVEASAHGGSNASADSSGPAKPPALAKPKKKPPGIGGGSTASAAAESPSTTAAESKQAQYTKCVGELLKKHVLTPELLEVQHLLNPILDLTLPVPASPVTLTAEGQHSAVQELLMTLLRAMTSVVPAMIIVDDGLYMHGKSWDMCLRVAAAASLPVGQPGALALLFVVSTRPLASYLDVVTPHVHDPYKAMRAAPYVRNVKLTRLPPKATQNLIRMCCTWGGSIDPQLLQWVEHYAQGNPLLVKEMLKSAIAQSMVGVDITRTLDVSEDSIAPGRSLVRDMSTGLGMQRDAADGPLDNALEGGMGASLATGLGVDGPQIPQGGVAAQPGVLALSSATDHRTSIPVSKPLMNMMGMRVDRLTTSQQMIMKVGSTVGQSFRYSLLFDAFPIERLRTALVKECDGLVKMGYLTKRTATIATQSSSSHKEPEFSFAMPFMFESVRRRVLAEQKRNLQGKINECKQAQAQAQRRMYLEGMIETMGNSALTKTAWMEVRKNVEERAGFRFPSFGKKKDWKRRFVCITADHLSMYKEEVDPGRPAQKHVQQIAMAGVQAEIVPIEDFGRPFVIKVESASWEKKGTSRDERRAFFMTAEDADMAQQWCDLIAFLADRSSERAPTRSRGRLSVRALQGGSSRALVKGGRGRAQTTTPESVLADLKLYSGYGDEGEGPILATNRVVLTIEGARHLLPGRYAGAPNPYVTIQLENNNRRTQVEEQAVDPKWNELKAFPITVQQAAGASLRFVIWDHDRFGGSRVIGVARLPLGSMTPEEGKPESEDDATAAQKKLPIQTIKLMSPSHADSGVVYGEPDTLSADLEPEGLSGGSLQRRSAGMFAHRSGDEDIFRGELRLKARLLLTKDGLRDIAKVKQRVEYAVKNSPLVPGFQGLPAPVWDGPFGKTVAVIDNQKHMLNAMLRLWDACGVQTISQWLDSSGNVGEARAAVASLTSAGGGGGGGSDGGRAFSPQANGGARGMNGRRPSSALTAKSETGSLVMYSASGVSTAVRELEAALNTLAAPTKTKAKAANGDGASSKTAALKEHLVQALSQLRSAKQNGDSEGQGGGTGSDGGHSSTSFFNMVSMCDLDTVNRRWLALEYTRENVAADEAERVSREARAIRSKSMGKDRTRSVASAKRNPSKIAVPRGWLSALDGLDSSDSEGDETDDQSVVSTDSYIPQVKDSTWQVCGGLTKRVAKLPLEVGGYGWGVSKLMEYGWGYQGAPAIEGVEEEDDDTIFANTNQFMNNAYYYDADESIEGPISGVIFREWYDDDDIPADMLVRRGDPANDEFELSRMLEQCLAFKHVTETERVLRAAGGVEDSDSPVTDPTSRLDSFTFDVFELPIEADTDLIPLVSYMLVGLRVPLVFRVEPSAFVSFTTAVRNEMSRHDRAVYHNWYHAFDVAQTTYVFLRGFEAVRLLTPLEVFGVFIAALAHDLGHPGLNNTYQINAGTELARQFNDQSVLENYHCVRCFELLTEHDVLQHLTPEQYRTIRKAIIQSILATDMTCHFGLTDELKAVGLKHAPFFRRAFAHQVIPEDDESKSQIEDVPTTPVGDDSDVIVRLAQTERSVMLKTILHAADISNPAKAWDIAKYWSDCVTMEFYAQGDLEKEEGLPVSPNMDRDTANQVQTSLNFIDFIVAPLFLAFSALVPRAVECCRILSDNREKWQILLDEELAGSRTDAAEEVRRAEKKRWARRKTAFQNVLMPATASTRQTASQKRASLYALESFVAANVSADRGDTPRTLSSIVIEEEGSELSDHSSVTESESEAESGDDTEAQGESEAAESEATPEAAESWEESAASDEAE